MRRFAQACILIALGLAGVAAMALGQERLVLAALMGNALMRMWMDGE